GRRLRQLVRPPESEYQPQGDPLARDGEKTEERDVIHTFTSPAPAEVRIWRTEARRSAAQCTATPKRSLVKRPSNVGDGRKRGRRPSKIMPMTVEMPPKRIVSSKAITTNGGMDATGLPPVMRPHCIADQMVRKNPDAVPVRPPMSVNSRTGLTGRSRSRTSSISCTGTGVYTVRS